MRLGNVSPVPCIRFGPLDGFFDGLLSFNSTSGGSSFAIRLAFFMHIDLQKASLIIITENLIKALSYL